MSQISAMAVLAVMNAHAAIGTDGMVWAAHIVSASTLGTLSVYAWINEGGLF